ncbi:microspherule protein 1 isoform X1 [Phacochoerus africanus]|uniref:microspherule protein 1 isoform X1 n=2 Tax=Phacochoerus africanus TaxID=41426 RepID=UPI001FD9C0F9|nr:microspherule protein 1 isoform X1 [Phacochoerus africanus]
MDKDSQGLLDSSLMASGTASRSEDEESLAGQKRASSQALGTIPKRRSSSRFIKRKKFDDELVESSLAKSSTRAKGASGVEPGRCSGSEPSSSEKKKVSKAPSTPVPPSPAPAPGLTKRVKKSKQPLQVTKDLGRWKPADDLLLINAVLQTNDLTSVHLGVKFSCRFTLREVQERWYALLYDPVISKLACQAMRQLHPEAIAAIQSKALFSKAEEQLLSKVGSTSQPTLETFQDLLHRHPDAFYLARTAKALQAHWQLMKQYYLLEDQTVQPLPKGDQVLNFSDAEDLIDDSKLKDMRDEVLEHGECAPVGTVRGWKHLLEQRATGQGAGDVRVSFPPHLTAELTVADRRQKREIRQLEQELHKWQVLVDSITGEEAGPGGLGFSSPRRPEPPAPVSQPPRSLPSVDLTLAPCVEGAEEWAVLQHELPSPRHELSGLRQPDPGGAAGPHGAVPDALARDHPGQSNQGQPDRRGPFSGGPSLEDLPEARGHQAEKQR